MNELFEIHNTKYSLNYDLKIISRIELLTNCSIMNMIASGVCSKEQLQIMLALGLIDFEGNHIKEKDAINMASELIQHNDPVQLARIVIGAMVTDCPFLTKDRGD